MRETFGKFRLPYKHSRAIVSSSQSSTATACTPYGAQIKKSSVTADKTITCRDCGQAFNFTIREQEFFAERGFGDPVRCLTCRRAHKAKRQEGDPGAAGSVAGGPVRDIERRYPAPPGGRPDFRGERGERTDDLRPGPRREPDFRGREAFAPVPPMPPLQEVSSRKARREEPADFGEDDGWAPKARKDGKKKRDRRPYEGDEDDW